MIFDLDGRLHFSSVVISKANICSYKGSELGLDPSNKTFRLLRHPDELEKAAAGFAGLPLLRDHFARGGAFDANAFDANANLVVGTIGSTRFVDPYLFADVSVWAGDAISAIVSGRKSSLSCSYRFEPEMRPGLWNGERYDGIMRSIEPGSHVALVESSRAGRDMELPTMRAA
jgi:uncharacterized protein